MELEPRHFDFIIFVCAGVVWLLSVALYERIKDALAERRMRRIRNRVYGRTRRS